LVALRTGSRGRRLLPRHGGIFGPAEKRALSLSLVTVRGEIHVNRNECPRFD
jgi:hypothetical protein